LQMHKFRRIHWWHKNSECKDPMKELALRKNTEHAQGPMVFVLAYEIVSCLEKIYNERYLHTSPS